MNKKKLFNILGFYLCWWLSIYGANSENYFLGISVLLFYMVVHFIFISYNYIEYYYIFICFILGFSIDTILLNFNYIHYKGYLSEHFKLAPFWVVCLWVSFGLSIFHSFSFLRKKYLYTMILGMISGPLIYYSCSRLEIISFSVNQKNILIGISILWSVLLPVYVFIADFLFYKYEK